MIDCNAPVFVDAVEFAKGSRMDQLSDMRLFVRAVDAASFSEAARTVGVSQSVVSKAVTRIEARLGVQLLRRTTRGMSLTEEGAEYHDAVVRLLTGMDDAETAISYSQNVASGRLRVSLSPSIGRRYVIPRLGDFLGEYPDISLDFDVSERHVSLTEGGIDVAIQFGPLQNANLIARRIGSVRRVTVAAPDLIGRCGAPERPADLSVLPCLGFSIAGALEPWIFMDNDSAFDVTPKVVMRTNDAEHLCGAAIRGLGVAQCPAYLVSEQIASGQLVELLSAFSPRATFVNAVSPAGRQPPRRVRAFIDFLASVFATIPELSVPAFRPRLVEGGTAEAGKNGGNRH